MKLTSDFNGSTLTIALDGDFDHHSAKSVREQADTLLIETNPAELLIDFARVTFMDSSGLGFVLGRYKKQLEHGGKIRLVNVSPSVKRILVMSGIDKLINIG